MAPSRLRTAPARDYRGLKLLALLLVAVLVPSACVLWFMNEAVDLQATASRAALADAYRGQLRLVRGRLNTYWESRIATLESNLPRNAPAAFHTLVTRGAADSAIVLAAEGAPLYPSLAVVAPDAAGASAATVAARAAQARVRDLVQKGQKQAAVEAIQRHFVSGRAAHGVDTAGRLIAADQHLLLVNLLGPSDARRRTAIERLTALLNNYATVTLPSPQRLFLMQQMQSIDTTIRFPTLEAERLAVALLESQRPARTGAGLRPTAVSEVWQASSPDGRVLALYRTSTVLTAMRGLLAEQSSPTVDFSVIPPGEGSADEAIAIGPLLPGWEVTFAPRASDVTADSARRRHTSYGILAMLAIAVIAAAAALLGGAARRQARLASLRSDLVSAVSHELKTPLASMRLLVDALLEDEQLDPVKTREYLHLMSVENARLTRLIENFLTFSRLDRGRQQFDLRPTNPSDVVRDTLAALPDSRRGERAPTVAIAPDLPSIRADQDALATVLLNLLDNAYKYSPADERIALRAFREGDHVVFAVEDHGIGIPAREQNRIFRRFYRVDQRLARDSAGSGLGLSIVDAIVRAHGGWVRVHSRPAEGSTFAVYLPCAPDGAPV